MASFETWIVPRFRRFTLALITASVLTVARFGDSRRLVLLIHGSSRGSEGRRDVVFVIYERSGRTW